MRQIFKVFLHTIQNFFRDCCKASLLISIPVGLGHLFLSVLVGQGIFNLVCLLKESIFSFSFFVVVCISLTFDSYYFFQSSGAW